MDSEFNVTVLYEIFATDFDVAAFQDAVWTPGITRFILRRTAQLLRAVLAKLREPVS
jgi:hypothetical protein